MKQNSPVLVWGLAVLLLSPSFSLAATTTSTAAKATQLEALIWSLETRLAALKSSNTLAVQSSVSAASIRPESGAAVNQTSVKSSAGKFTLSGTATGPNAVFVALVDARYTGSTDWHSIYTSHSYAAFTGDSVIRVRRGRWAASFIGVPQGAYKVLIYENDDASQTLLGTGNLVVSSAAVTKFRTNSVKPIILGVGQSATDGGVTIRLVSAGYSNGTTGTSVARFLIASDGYDPAYYEGGIGDKIPQNGGIGDSKAKNGGVTITITAIAPWMNAATILVKADAAKG